jgi:hypothetical protein
MVKVSEKEKWEGRTKECLENSFLLFFSACVLLLIIGGGY